MKRIRLIAMVLAMGLLWGCSSEKQASEEATQPPKPKIGLCVRNLADAPAYYGALEAELGQQYTVCLVDCGNDQSQQDQKVAELALECDLLVVEPVMVTALDTVLDTVAQQAVPVIMLDREPAREILDGNENLYYLGLDLRSGGQAQAALTGNLPAGGDLNGDGTVSYMILRGPTDHMDAQAITAGCESAMAGQCLATADAQWTVEDGRAKCAQVLNKFGPDLEVILCNSPELTQGAVEAVRNCGWMPGQDVYVLGFGYKDGIQTLLDQGAVSGTVWVSDSSRAQLLQDLVRKVLAGEPADKCVYAPWDQK